MSGVAQCVTRGVPTDQETVAFQGKIILSHHKREREREAEPRLGNGEQNRQRISHPSRPYVTVTPAAWQDGRPTDLDPPPTAEHARPENVRFRIGVFVRMQQAAVGTVVDHQVLLPGKDTTAGQLSSVMSWSITTHLSCFKLTGPARTTMRLWLPSFSNN